ncbi:MAG: hypothetical protein AAGH92_02990 [Planctomycetota bacterium]
MTDQRQQSRKSIPLFLKVIVGGSVVLMLGILLLPAIISIDPAPASVVSMVNMRQIQIAAHSYAVDHKYEWPDVFDRFSHEYLVGCIEDERSVFINPREGYLTYRLVHPGMPLDEIEDPASVPVLYEVRVDGTIDPHGIIGYADGHVAWSPDRDRE